MCFPSHRDHKRITHFQSNTSTIDYGGPHRLTSGSPTAPVKIVLIGTKFQFGVTHYPKPTPFSRLITRHYLTHWVESSSQVPGSGSRPGLVHGLHETKPRDGNMLDQMGDLPQPTLIRSDLAVAFSGSGVGYGSNLGHDRVWTTNLFASSMTTLNIFFKLTLLHEVYKINEKIMIFNFHSRKLIQNMDF